MSSRNLTGTRRVVHNLHPMVGGPDLIYFWLPVCTTQGSGGRFKEGKPKRRLIAVNHASQSETTDGPTSGWKQRSGVAIVVEM